MSSTNSPSEKACDNSFCFHSIDNDSTESDNQCYCRSCNKYFCRSCSMKTPLSSFCDVLSEHLYLSYQKKHSNQLSCCLYCGMPLEQSPLYKPIQLFRNSVGRKDLTAAIQARFNMDSDGAGQVMGVCSNCGHRTYVDKMDDLCKTKCKHCGTTCYQANSGKIYKAENETLEPNQETYDRSINNLYLEMMNAVDDQTIFGYSRIKNWIYANSWPIHFFQFEQALRNSEMDSLADVIKETLNPSED